MNPNRPGLLIDIVDSAGTQSGPFFFVPLEYLKSGYLMLENGVNVMFFSCVGDHRLCACAF